MAEVEQPFNQDNPTGFSQADEVLQAAKDIDRDPPGVNRLPNTIRTRVIADAELEWRENNPLADDSPEAREAHEGGAHVAGMTAAWDYDMHDQKVENISKDIRDKLGYKVSKEEFEEKRDLENREKTDWLTGLPDAKEFEAAYEASKNDGHTVVVSIDVNYFGDVNKDLDEDAGDAALILISQAIREAALRHGVTERRVFRKGGDEFEVLAPSKEIGELIAEDAERLFDGYISRTETIPGNPSGELLRLGDPVPSDPEKNKVMELLGLEPRDNYDVDVLKAMRVGVVAVVGEPGESVKVLGSELQRQKHARKDDDPAEFVKAREVRIALRGEGLRESA